MNFAIGFGKTGSGAGTYLVTDGTGLAEGNHLALTATRHVFHEHAVFAR
jgi:hypothetical protein